MNGELVQQIHQGDNTADDFGKAGDATWRMVRHHVYFVGEVGGRHRH